MLEFTMLGLRIRDFLSALTVRGVRMEFELWKSKLISESR
jgi:tRNA G26 N,N-dimethylase Trm1